MTNHAVIHQNIPLKLLSIDDHPLFREAVGRVLGGLDHPVEMLQADSVARARSVLDAQPDLSLILLDLILLDAQGPNVLEQVRRMRPDVPVVVLSELDDRATVLAAFDAGAMGFVSKRATSTVLLGAVRLVLAGGVYVPPDVLDTAAPASNTAAPASSALDADETAQRRNRESPRLTRRHIEVLTLLARGKPNKAICRELGLAEGTVKTYACAIFRALGVSNRTQAAYAASRLGIELSLPVAEEPAVAGSLPAVHHARRPLQTPPKARATVRRSCEIGSSLPQWLARPAPAH